jgi:hypothetical protein
METSNRAVNVEHYKENFEIIMDDIFENCRCNTIYNV